MMLNIAARLVEARVNRILRGSLANAVIRTALGKLISKRLDNNKEAGLKHSARFFDFPALN
jgi:hypothetical protein